MTVALNNSKSELHIALSLRPCELQISDFENAAVCCFVVLLTRSILSYKWNLLMPISLVDENMKRAQVQRCSSVQ